MEIFWYILAAIGAGVGTGLAGLSAATVMVPILIVMCPSFSGEAGAYQATAIALASDILGSAITTGVYIKNRNIDLKRGWIMLACIVTMCVAGSYAAWLAGNTVLGSFSLFLTFCIGIRFLVKPDSSRKDTAEGKGLDAKGIVISLFFGLTIGFGTGFVGSGGGMMMLIVFTAFLGMGLKKAVGTSTFIMTFTALIASVSHIMIEPSILTEKYSALIICIAVTSAASYVSAKFANKVSSRTVGLATGVCLTVLGGAMILLNYRTQLAESILFAQTVSCFIKFLIFIIIGAVTLIILHLTCRIPRYVFRKLLHLVAFSSAVVLVICAESWLSAAIASLFFGAIVYPILVCLEGCSWYDGLFVQKQKGEIKLSLLLLFATVAGVIALSWGLTGKRYIAAATLLMWGVGDAAAALVGIPFGKRKIGWKIADGNKTVEGTSAMLAAAFICGFVSLMAMSSLPWYSCALTSLLCAAAAAFTELVSRKGYDTVTVPLAAGSLMTFLLAVMG
ncbi:MAG: TSUP family transporter [Oscillospiraceae bacterium]|nr:TSUP family transporter [Oscillospiraceae bacterium]